MHICVTGPESSGKSTLSLALAEQLQVEAIPEYAREYLSVLERPYTSKDLLKIAEGQKNVFGQARNQSDVSISDTGIEVISIWHKEKFGLSKHLDSLLDQQHKFVDLYVLCSPDIPWEPDPMRENPKDRDRLFHLYEKLLKKDKVIYMVVSGSEPERLNAVLETVNHIS